MILGVLSDTHLRDAHARLEAVLRGPLGPADVLIHAGDFTGEEVLDYLESVDSRPFFGVAGNMDSPGIRARLPDRRVLELGGYRIGLAHGWGAPAGLAGRLLAAFSEPLDILVFGHSHRPSQEWRGSRLLLNPGSAFDRRWAARCTVALVDLAAKPVVRILEVEG